jgi:hypothetical protein
MSPWKRRVFAMCLIGTSLLLAAVAQAVAPEIRDDGKFFSAAALKKANELIAEMSRKHNVDFLVETYATVPADQVERVRFMDSGERGEFFKKWAMDRSKTRVVNGVYALICKEPEHFIVGITGTGVKAFPAGNRAKLEEAMRREFAEKRFDEGLFAGIRFAQDRLGKGTK